MADNKIGKLKIKSLTDLIDEKSKTDLSPFEEATPSKSIKKARNVVRKAATTTKKIKVSAQITANQIVSEAGNTVAVNATVRKHNSLSTKKEPSPSQLRIDSFFKSATKSFKIEATVGPSTCKQESSRKTTTAKRRAGANGKKAGKRRGRRLFDDTSDTEESNITFPEIQHKNGKRKSPQQRKQLQRSAKKGTPIKEEEFTIDLCSDDNDVNVENSANIDNVNLAEKSDKVQTEIEKTEDRNKLLLVPHSTFEEQTTHLVNTNGQHCVDELPETAMVSIPLNDAACTNQSSNYTNGHTSSDAKNEVPDPKSRIRKPRACPPYKVVEGTTFAVDAFQYGEIPNVTHYFLSHYHADHYVGLTRKFAQTLYASPITARLLQTFIPFEQPEYLHEIELNEPQTINDIEVTALDANHCPGAIMLLFKFSTGKCILHTGDFRASHDMESEPIFWNNPIDLLYLDTTYLSSKYDFCTQYESITVAKCLVHKFQEKHAGKRILYVCGAYVIGKEKIWSQLAEEFQLNVWAEPTRYKSLKTLNIPAIDLLLVENREQADMHVISMMKLNYLDLYSYFEPFRSKYDCLLAIRPSGWEKNSKPQYRGLINIVGIEYSEHSSYKELERFVKFLKPKTVISTVPVNGRDLFRTGDVPRAWYTYNTKYPTMLRKFQPSITTFLKLNQNTPASTKQNQSVKINNMDVSPTKSKSKRRGLSLRGAASQDTGVTGTTEEEPQMKVLKRSPSISAVFENAYSTKENSHATTIKSKPKGRVLRFRTTSPDTEVVSKTEEDPKMKGLKKSSSMSTVFESAYSKKENSYASTNQSKPKGRVVRFRTEDEPQLKELKRSESMSTVFEREFSTEKSSHAATGKSEVSGCAKSANEDLEHKNVSLILAGTLEPTENAIASVADKTVSVSDASDDWLT